MIKLLKIFNEPAPYMVDLHKYLSKNSEEHPELEYSGYFIFRSSSQKWSMIDTCKLLGMNVSKQSGLFKRFRNWFSEIRPKIDYCDFVIIPGYSPIENFLTSLYCVLTKKPYGYHYDSWRRSKKSLGFLLSKFFFRRASVLLAGGIRQRDFVIDHFGVSESRVLMAPLTVDVSRFRMKSKREDRRIRIVCLGRLIYRKRFDVAIEAMKLLNEDPYVSEKIELLVAGEGPELNNLRSQAQNMDNIRFLGFVKEEDVPKILADSDILLHPASFEPWGLVVVEAMLCGLVTIVTQQVGAGDLIDNSIDGFVIDESSPELIRNLIMEIVSDDEMCLKIGQKARNKILEEWSFEKWDNPLREITRLVSTKWSDGNCMS